MNYQKPKVCTTMDRSFSHYCPKKAQKVCMYTLLCFSAVLLIINVQSPGGVMDPEHRSGRTLETVAEQVQVTGIGKKDEPKDALSESVHARSERVDSSELDEPVDASNEKVNALNEPNAPGEPGDTRDEPANALNEVLDAPDEQVNAPNKPKDELDEPVDAPNELAEPGGESELMPRNLLSAIHYTLDENSTSTEMTSNGDNGNMKILTDPETAAPPNGESKKMKQLIEPGKLSCVLQECVF